MTDKTIRYWDDKNGPYEVPVPEANVDAYLETHPGAEVVQEPVTVHETPTEPEYAAPLTTPVITEADIPPATDTPIHDAL